MRRCTVGMLAALALFLLDSRVDAPPEARVVTSLPVGPTVLLELRTDPSSPLPRARIVLETAAGETIIRHEGPLPIVMEVPRAVPLLLLAEAPGRARHHEMLRLEGDRTLHLTLGEGARITGRVVDERGEAISGATIRISKSDTERPWLTQTSDDGRFTVDTLHEGVHHVVASARGHVSAARVEVETGSAPLEITLERVSLVAGRVIRPDGRAAADASVVIAGSGIWPARRVETNAEGRFRFGDIPPGIYEVRASAGDLVAEPRRGLEVAPGKPAFLTFALREGFALRGIVRDAASGAPIEGAEITVSGQALDVAPRTATSGTDGRFTIRGLTPGAWLVSAFADGYVPINAREHESRAPLELALDPAATLAGVVLDEDGRPLEGATIEVIGDTAERQPIAIGPEAGFRASVFASHGSPLTVGPGALEVTEGPVPPIPLGPTEHALSPLPPSTEEIRARTGFVSDENGRFRVSGVPPGRVQLIARAPGRAPASTARLYVTAGSERDDLKLVLRPAGRLRGTLEDSRGDPIAKVLVEVRSDREPYPRFTFTSDEGDFEIEDVFGELSVTAMPQGRPPLRSIATVGSGETVEIALVLEGELHNLGGRTIDERGFPIARAQLTVVSLRPDSPFRRTYFAADDGTFTLAELPAPPWRIEASDPDYAPSRLDVARPTDRLEVILATGAEIRGSVVDDYTNEPVEARVLLLRDDLPPELRETRSGPDGFRFTRVPTGRWLLRIESEAHLAVEQEVELSERGLDLDAIRLTPAGWLEGTVVDALGAPVRGAKVFLEDGGPSALTDAAGEFVLRRAPPGVVRVRAEHPAAGEGRSTPQRVLVGRETVGVVVRLSERFDPERAEALPGRRRGVALEVEGRRGRIAIRRVIGGSHAERAGLRAGDVLERIDGETPESAAHAARLLRGPMGVAAVLDIRRGERRATLLVERESWLPSP